MENIEWNRFILRANRPIRPNAKNAYRMALKGMIALFIALVSALALVAASLQSKSIYTSERPTLVPSVSHAISNHETKTPVKPPLLKAMDAAK